MMKIKTYEMFRGNVKVELFCFLVTRRAVATDYVGGGCAGVRSGSASSEGAILARTSVISPLMPFAQYYIATSCPRDA